MGVKPSVELGLKDKVVLVTGASKGIGQAIARGFADEGAHLSICARGRDLLEEMAREIERQAGVEVR